MAIMTINFNDCILSKISYFVKSKTKAKPRQNQGLIKKTKKEFLKEKEKEIKKAAQIIIKQPRHKTGVVFLAVKKMVDIAGKNTQGVCPKIPL